MTRERASHGPGEPDAERATHAQVRLLIELSRGRERERGLCLVEGPIVLGEVLAAGCVPELVAATAAVRERHAELLRRLATAGATVVSVDEGNARRISDRKRAPGLVAAVRRPRPWSTSPAPSGPALVPVLWGLQDPGNVGTLLRSARAFSAAGCLLTLGSADVYGPKVVRASTGAGFGLPTAAIDGEHGLLEHVAGWGLELLEAVSGAAGEPSGGELPERCLLVLGHETRGTPGLPGARAVRVAHEPSVESLNVAMAGSILMADWYRTHRR